MTGRSGAGKSSLLKALTGTLREFQGGDVRGTVRIDAAGEHSATVGFVPQDARDAFLAHDPLTEFQLRLQTHGWKYRAAREEAMRLLGACAFQRRARVPIHRLSAGERRRLALFAARLHRPGILLLDEPLNHLDHDWRNAVINDICGVAEKALVIVATHEVDPWLPVANAQVHVENGVAATETGTPSSKEDDWNRGPARQDGEALVVSGLADAQALFENVNLRLGNGLHAIAGPNGSGKSTLLRILGGLERPKTGRVVFGSHDLHSLPPPDLARFRAHHIEEPRETFFMEKGVDEIRFQPRNAGFPKDEVNDRALRAADTFALGALVERHPLSLSGGEQERVALACTHAARAKLVLLDEPTHGLDPQGRASLLRFLSETSKSACIVLATHDERLMKISDTVHRFEDQQLQQVRGTGSRPIVEVRPRAP